uniref:protein CutA homolog isoform X2 n=1 Tax=Myodes glareolus TaxID=447135 RepID=UPI0020220E34|nr:protein CutA homolog isoform X2 [Myodes glareolus]
MPPDLSCEQLVGGELRSLEVLNVLEAVWCLMVTSPLSCLPCGILAVILTYPLLRTFTLWLHSSLTRNHISGTYSVVFVNCPNEQIAKDVARAILDKKLATSVNILPKTSSLYFWKGEIEESTEILLLIKTKTSKVSRLSTYVRLAHPFEIPEVFSIAMDQGDARYLKWLEEGMKEK